MVGNGRARTDNGFPIARASVTAATIRQTRATPLSGTRNAFPRDVGKNYDHTNTNLGLLVCRVSVHTCRVKGVRRNGRVEQSIFSRTGDYRRRAVVRRSKTVFRGNRSKYSQCGAKTIFKHLEINTSSVKLPKGIASLLFSTLHSVATVLPTSNVTGVLPLRKLQKTLHGPRLSRVYGVFPAYGDCHPYNGVSWRFRLRVVVDHTTCAKCGQ